MYRIHSRYQWEDVISWNGDDTSLSPEEEDRAINIQNLLADALEAANRGGDYSTPILEIIRKYGSYEEGSEDV